jgi:dTDP-4-dehydrorhamnose 3,5-epimerase
MRFTECAIPGAWVIDPTPHADDRGRFMRAWCADEFLAHGITFVPVQANLVFSKRAGTLRGMHYQVAPHLEAKLVRCTRGGVFDVLVDLRPGSATFGRWYGTDLTAENGRMLYVPPMCAHASQALADDTEIHYMASAAFAPDAARGLRYDDSTVAVRWPLTPAHLSGQDRGWPHLPIGG